MFDFLDHVFCRSVCDARDAATHERVLPQAWSWMGNKRSGETLSEVVKVNVLIQNLHQNDFRPGEESS